MSELLKFRWSGSTLMAVLTVAALWIAYRGDGFLPEQLLGITILFVLPIVATITTLWSVISFIRRVALQHAAEFAAGAIALLTFYYHVIRAPI